MKPKQDDLKFKVLSKKEAEELEKLRIKTLKDIECSCGQCDCTWISKHKLKAEAVKRARYFKEKMSCGKTAKPLSYWEGRFDEAMQANNLTEEDLK